jgi:hypothetical protein
VSYDLMPLPKDPMPAVRCLLDYYRGSAEEVPWQEAGHALLHLASYAYAMVDNHALSQAAASAPVADTEDGLVNQLERLEAGGPQAYGAFPWATLLLMVINILQQLLRENGG